MSDASVASGEPTSRIRDADVDAEARSRFRIGQILYEEGRYAEAAREFDAAHRLSPRPSLLYNAYLAHRDAGELEQAIRSLEQYLVAAPEADENDALRRRVEVMRDRLEAQRAQTEAAASERERLESERARLAREAEAARQRAALAEARARPSSPAPFIVLASGLGTLAVAAGTAFATNQRLGKLDVLCPNHLCPPGSNSEHFKDRVSRMALTTDVLLATGGAAVVAASTWLFVRRHHRHREERRRVPSVVASPSRRGLGLSLGLPF